ncbi:MAG TPA: hypothetical protein VK543_00375 [Puia sp.]|nr:hypothetical protein [Puia sp.]
MKHDVMPSIVQMGQEELQQLVQEVKETVATEMSKPKASKSSIKVVDLWNIHRSKRSAKSLMKSRAISNF